MIGRVRSPEEYNTHSGEVKLLQVYDIETLWVNVGILSELQQ